MDCFPLGLGIRSAVADLEIRNEEKKLKQKLKRLELADGQFNLLGKTFGQLRGESDAEIELKTLFAEKALYQHLLECDVDDSNFLCVVIGIERYMGRNLPWYLSPQYDGYGFDEEDVPELETFPRVDDYEIGWYGKDNQPGTHQFIKDRATWATKLVDIRIKELKESILNCQKVKW